MITWFGTLFLSNNHLSRFDATEHPIVAQIGGSNKYKMLEAAQLLEAKGYDAININCGCPSPKVAVHLLLVSFFSRKGALEHG